MKKSKMNGKEIKKRSKKRIASLFLATLLATSAVFPAFAEETDEMKEVLLSIKERISGTDDFKDFETVKREQNGEVTYSFLWQSPNEDDESRIRATATSSGIITDYYCMDGTSYYSDTPRLNQISVSEAATRTKNLVDKLNPKISDKLVIVTDGVTQNLYQNSFTFELQRYENGIRVCDNNGSVRVNSDATKIISFYLSYDENLTFPDAASVMTKEEAQKAYGEKIGMSLEYRADYDYKNKTISAVPVYIPADSKKYINALTGETEEFFYNDALTGGGGSLELSKNEAASDASGGLSAAEETEFENIEGLKSKDELASLVKSNSYIGISDDMTLIYYDTSKAYYEDIYKAALSFVNDSEEDYAYVYVTLNMKTGELISFYKSRSDGKSASEKLSDEEIKKIKDKAVFDLAGEKANEYRYDEKSKKYIRYVSEIPFRSDSISVEVAKNGEIDSYSISYTDIEFPSVKGVISAETALNSLFSQVSYEYAYAKMNYKDTEAKLIYMLDNSSVRLDAFTGKLLNDDTEYEKASFNGYSDISGHYAEEKIETLAKFGIFFEGTECKPNEPVKQKDFIALLVSTFNSGSSVVLRECESYSSEYVRAKRENIIMPEEENPEEVITRESAAKYMIRAMGLEKVASIPNIYACPFADVVNFKGQISILSGLKIVSGDGNGSFYPESVLTRADALVMIYNYLANSAE